MRRIALVIVAAAGLTAAASAVAQTAGDVQFSGKTQQRKPVILAVGPTGAMFRIDWAADCHDGGDPFEAQTSSQRPLPIQGGRFASHEKYDAKAADGATVHYEISLTGRVTRRAAKGTWRAKAKGPYADGDEYKCDTGKLSWKARRGSAPAATP
jgi:hypothetical protein